MMITMNVLSGVEVLSFIIANIAFVRYILDDLNLHHSISLSLYIPVTLGGHL